MNILGTHILHSENGSLVTYININLCINLIFEFSSIVYFSHVVVDILQQVTSPRAKVRLFLDSDGICWDICNLHLNS